MTILISLFILAGCFFSLLAALGVLRMPDFYCRLHAATKAGAFGVALSLIALCIAIPTLRVFIQSGLIIFFFYLTAPVAAHALGRVALLRKVPMWKSKKGE